MSLKNDVSIAIIHNRIMSYRVPFFEGIAKRFDVTFLLSREPGGAATGDINSKQFQTYFGIAIPLLTELIRGDYDIIVNSEIAGISGLLETTLVFLIAKLRGIPHVMWTERYDAPTTNIRTKVLTLVYRVIMPHSEVCFVPARRHREFALDCGAARDDIVLLPNISRLADSPCDYKVDSPLALDSTGSGPTILYVGRLEKVKGVEYLLYAFSTLLDSHPDASLIIVGSGSDEPRLRTIVQDESMSGVTFAGWQSRSDLPKYYEAADLLVLPSVTRTSPLSGGSYGDAFGLVCLEASAFRTPVICTTAVGAAHEVVRDGENGYVVPEKDVQALAGAMTDILSNQQLQSEMADESEQIACEYSYDRMVEAFEKGIRQAMFQ